MVEEKIKDKIKKALEELKLPGVEVGLEHPGDDSHGDYSTNVALIIKSSKSTPEGHANGRTGGQVKVQSKYRDTREIAEAIAKKLRSYPLKAISKIEVAEAGFINFWLSEHFLLAELKSVTDLGEKYGKGKSRKEKKIMVEFAHPNTLKQFHIGHMRNICLGESLVRLLESQGAKVIRTNYQGDVGLHVAKALWGAEKLGLPSDKLSMIERVKFLGKAYVEGNKAFEDSKKSKKEIQDLNVRIYQKDKKIKKLWEQTREWSLEYFDWIYKRVYSKFDRLYFESEVADQGKKASLAALKKGVLSRSQGAVVFDGKPFGIHTRVFLTRENLPTYEGKELGLAILEFSEFGEIDKCIHVVGPEQTSFFEVTFKVEELLDPEKYKGKQEHFAYGYVNMKSGKMSSREGTILSGEWLLDEAQKRIKKIVDKSDLPKSLREEIVEKVAVGAVKYSMLKVSPVKNISFDFEESVSLEGNSGPYLQYTYARAHSVLSKAKDISFKGSTFKGMVINAEELVILRWLYRFPEAVVQAADEYAPNVICTYLYELAGRFNTFYNKHSILRPQNKESEARSRKSGEDLRIFRLALTASVVQVLKNGLNLLGIKAPSKM
jgi:arginyl-tRNA synthetase